jgi:hypothetical protein
MALPFLPVALAETHSPCRNALVEHNRHRTTSRRFHRLRMEGIGRQYGPEYNQPALRIKQARNRGGAASIRIDDPNPDIEFVETDQKGPARSVLDATSLGVATPRTYRAIYVARNL